MTPHNTFEFEALYEWYLQHGRKTLPWRKHQPGDRNQKQNGYLVWLSEILLQQTQADRVIGYYEAILARFPDIEALAEVDYETFFPYYEWLGYYSRARNLLACAKIVCETYQGVFPQKTEDLIKLPGIGPYTAEAIRSFAYGIPTLSFDTNLKKVLARYYFGTRFHPLSKEMEGLLLEDFITFTAETGISSADMNAAFMDLGSLWSKNAKNTIDFSKSPFHSCLFTQTQGDLETQTLQKKKYFPIADAQIIVILHENHTTYFSAHSESYVPFILPPLSTGEGSTVKNIRDWVKWFFYDSYKLKVSVRPDHKKEYRNMLPTVFVRAQIQDGKSYFTSYQKQALWSEFSEDI
jgi:A/G-specific adenine glycosylase